MMALGTTYLDYAPLRDVLEFLSHIEPRCALFALLSVLQRLHVQTLHLLHLVI